MRTYVLTKHEKRKLQEFLTTRKLDHETRNLLLRCRMHISDILDDAILALRALNKFERVRKRERN